jgi:hypothetical protein
MKKTPTKNPHAVALGKLGGAGGTGKAKARTTAQARKAGKAGALARWGDKSRRAAISSARGEK